MTRIKPEGVIPAVVTPFNEKEEINEEALRELVNFLIEKGVHGLAPTGSSGEGYALSREEKKKVIETVVDEANGKVPVYAGTGATNTKEATALTKMAEDIGADAVMVITPYYISPTEDELYDYYTSIAENTDLPVILYNNPRRTGVNISADLVARLSQIDNIIGIKDSSGNMTLTIEYIRRTGENFSVLAGRDTLIYSTLVAGGAGTVSIVANVVPEIVVELYKKFREGKWEEARDIQYKKITPLRMAFNKATFPQAVKDALILRGINVGKARSPLRPLDQSALDEIKSMLENIIGELDL